MDKFLETYFHVNWLRIGQIMFSESQPYQMRKSPGKSHTPSKYQNDQVHILPISLLIWIKKIVMER